MCQPAHYFICLFASTILAMLPYAYRMILIYESTILLRDRFKLIRVLRIERTKYVDSIYGKIGDFTSRTIHELIREGEGDAHNAFRTLQSSESASIQQDCHDDDS
jgi:hypothetical protein